jgi:AraC-like DNA-binding protein
MTDLGVHGSQIEVPFRMNYASTIPPRARRKTPSAVERPRHDLALQQPKTPAFTSEYDFDPSAHLGTLFESLQSDSWHTERNGVPQANGHASAPGQLDPVVHHLRLAIQPALARPEDACKIFLNHIALALHAYCAHAYGETRITTPAIRGGLAPWQLRRAKEMLMAHLEADISLSEVARACKLSVSHFARAFRRTTGQPPHRWLTCRRVERAKELLRQSSDRMADIALRCGFADQASFIRAFKRVVGASPGGWRRVSRA